MSAAGVDATIVPIVSSDQDFSNLRVQSKGTGSATSQEVSHTSPIRITFKNLSLSVKDTNKARKGQQLYLLKDVFGFFEPGEMAALMGPSGSGKTTLLDLLAGRKTVGNITGDMLFAGQRPTREFLRRYTGYVEQFDTLLGILSVEEMLMYTAELKRPLSEALSSKKVAVQELIVQLGLEECRKVRIGSKMDTGISGGQAKRTNIGIALITNPRVLFLDEPTTGLDSYTANEVMVVVQNLAKQGVTICATVHSPTSFCFNLFDRLFMLVRGQLVYFGPQGQAVIDHFERCGVEPSGAVVRRDNISEYLVDLIMDADRVGKGDQYAAAYSSSSVHGESVSQLERYLREAKSWQMPAELAAELAVKRATVTPWWWGLLVFIKYRTTKNYSNPAWVMPRVADKLVIGLLILTLYLGIGDNFRENNIINISAVLFMWSATTGFAAANYIPALVLDRALFVRERADGLYLVFTYLTAKMVDELLMAAISSVPVSAFVFYGIQLQGSFVAFWLAYYVAVCAGIILAYFVAAISPNMDVANGLLPTYGVTLLFFAGFFITFDSMPPWWSWYSWICFSRYSWGAVMINQFENHDAKYNDKTVLTFYRLNGLDKYAYIGYTSLFFVFFYIATWLVLAFRKFQIR